jgi:hypothetical protein
MPFQISIYTQPSTANALRFFFGLFLRESGTITFSCIQTAAVGCLDNSFYVHHHHGGVLGGEGAVDQDFECCYVCLRSGDVTGVVESVAAHGEPDTFRFFLVRFVIAEYFAASDLSVFRDVSQCGKETCVGPRNVTNALE